MSSEIEAIAAKLNVSKNISQILNSRGTETEGDKIIALDLSGLNLSDLQSGVFDGLKDIKRLNLGYNQITTIDSKIFSGLSKLTFLSFFNNQISEIPDDFLTLFPDLEWLDLRENGLTKVPSSVVGLKKLKYLYLQNNPDLTTDEHDFSADYHSTRDVGKFVEEFQKATGTAPAESATPKKMTKKTTKKTSEKVKGKTEEKAEEKTE
ncbi:MAG: leucine-rich repeat domain-containing protein [Candidatus Heimdallarchaeota archaeon]